MPDTICDLWDYTTAQGVGTALVNTDRNIYLTADASNVPTPMPTNQDWVVQLVLKRNNIPESCCSKAIEIGTAIRVDYDHTEYITIVQDIDYPLYNFTNEMFHTLTFHYKAANSRIDIWLDDVLVYADIQKLSAGSYAIDRILLRGQTSYVDVTIGQLLAYVPGDFDDNCYVDLADAVLLAQNWLEGRSHVAGLLAWWKLDEGVGATAQDSTLSNNDAAITGAAWAVGHDGWALDFQDIDYLTIPPQALASLSDEITITFWQFGNPDIQPQADYLFEAQDADGRVLACHLPWSDARIYWDAGNDSGGAADRIYKTASQSSEFEGQWNHWALTKNANTGYMRMYLNGVPWHSDGPGYTRTMEGITSFKIGSNIDGTNNYDGIIDDFRVYSRELTPTEIADIYAP